MDRLPDTDVLELVLEGEPPELEVLPAGHAPSSTLGSAGSISCASCPAASASSASTASSH
ncbi:thiocillin family RiPP [Streptomyces tirandamycinicus]|uniref:Thiocillin family RiPP n=1 Tax=Streptomyces tirandamycinicus TaxID=2174846 RepID=A0A2S1SRN9_9ACTN|nr:MULTISPECIES: thiocillin family RiPP [Streptomyces]AWI29063.1 thiocillin family RiPP [Streptomyces tirandamycinicus]MCY0980056.1 thiocillin family RiPP [Streptomyces tirandamycinicus]NNJ03979.1 thiocillin family RiPP [Streptomyces sp. PKU-MA01144]TFE58663.1 thiocillin family RiPP [Streptomyces sp. ICN441]